MRSIDRAMLSRHPFTAPGPCTDFHGPSPNGGGNPCNPTPAPLPPPSITNVRNIGATTYIGAVPVAIKGLPVIDTNGAIANGFQSGSTYALNGYGQNRVSLGPTLRGYGSGTYQYGTTTITSHPTLPIARWTDPVHGSGVVYFDGKTQTINLGYSGDNGGFYMQSGAPGELKTNPFTLMGKIGIGLTVLGAVLH